MLRKMLLGGVASSFVVLASGAANAVIFYGDEMDRAREMQPAASSFDGYLAREYRDFFLFEADEMYDWIDADYFAEKALAANRHGDVQPENPAEWDIDEAHMPALVEARQGLMGAFAKGAKEKAPEAAAIVAEPEAPAPAQPATERRPSREARRPERRPAPTAETPRTGDGRPFGEAEVPAFLRRPVPLKA